MTPLAEVLSKQHLVYAPDLPGHGRSGRPSHVLDIGELAEALKQWLDAQRIRSAVFVGNSMGAQVVVELGCITHERMEAAVLLGPTMDQTRSTPYAHIWRLLSDQLVEPPWLVPLQAYDYLSEGPLRTWREFQHAVQHDMLARISFLRAPTLILRGSRDPIVSRAFVEQLATRLPNGHLRTIEGAGHALNYNSPRETARLIEKFLDATAREGRATARSADHRPSPVAAGHLTVRRQGRQR